MLIRVWMPSLTRVKPFSTPQTALYTSSFEPYSVIFTCRGGYCSKRSTTLPEISEALVCKVRKKPISARPRQIVSNSGCSSGSPPVMQSQVVPAALASRAMRSHSAAFISLPCFGMSSVFRWT